MIYASKEERELIHRYNFAFIDKWFAIEIKEKYGDIRICTSS